MKPGQPGKWIREIYDVFALTKELEWLHKRINEVYLVGDMVMDRTLTAVGLTGAKTINKLQGTVRFAAGASSLTVTNSFVNQNSFVFCSVRSNDSTAAIKNVVSAVGAFTITLSAAATAETEVAFWVTN